MVVRRYRRVALLVGQQQFDNVATEAGLTQSIGRAAEVCHAAKVMRPYLETVAHR